MKNNGIYQLKKIVIMNKNKVTKNLVKEKNSKRQIVQHKKWGV